MAIQRLHLHRIHGTPATLSYPTRRPSTSASSSPGSPASGYPILPAHRKHGSGLVRPVLRPSETTDTSVTINNLPHNGENIYVRLFSLTGGFWLYKDYNFFAFTGTPATLNPISGHYAQRPHPDLHLGYRRRSYQYALRVGSTVLLDRRVLRLDQTTNLSASVPYLPTNGRPLRPLFSLTGGFWLYNDYTFTAFTERPRR